MSPIQEVVMRPPEVFVRELSPEEGARLKSISKRAKYQSKRQRAAMLLASASGMPARQIAAAVRSDESHVRKVIHAFNERGFDALDPDYRGGRPKKTTPAERDRIVALARTRPDHRGVPLTRWSLPKLQTHLAGMGILLSAEALRQTLIGAGLSHQRTRSWKWSPDPEFQGKAERVLSLCRERPSDGVVVCFDEMGPIQLIPHQGSGWAPRKRCQRHRATYKRPHGVRYLFGDYDVHADRLHGRLRAHKNAGEVLAYYRQIRMRYDPALRIYLIADNLSTHKTLEIREWANESNVELVFTPTYASFLNRIESHFWAIGEFVVKNADYPDWDTLAKAMADHIRYRNGPHRDQRLIKAERRLLIAA
ncbi:MAG TPA: IS630 family transposase [Solirubrobacteraceae bacterium]|nr:IS630 family transposase [Solirubrobacteraceae bacterium]